MRKSTHTARYKKLVTALKAARLEKGMTQAELARRLKKPQSFVAKYEQSERRLDVLEFLIVSETLEVDPISLLDHL